MRTATWRSAGASQMGHGWSSSTTAPSSMSPDVMAPLVAVSWPSSARRCPMRASIASSTRWRATSSAPTASQPEPASLAETDRQLLDRAEEHVLVVLGLFEGGARHVWVPCDLRSTRDAEPRHEVRLVLICVGASICGLSTSQNLVTSVDRLSLGDQVAGWAVIIEATIHLGAVTKSGVASGLPQTDNAAGR